MNIAITSGKGGTGKTFVTVNLARSFVGEITVCDCDVEEPNCNLYLKGEEISSSRFSVMVPELEESKCTGCGICAQVCQFNAIIMLGGKPMVFEDLCHSCAACTLLCPEKALKEVPHETGTIIEGQLDSTHLIYGLLDIGKALAVPLIREVKRRATGSTILIDSPPGTSCPMVWSVQESDAIVLVGESTPFGLHDLKLAIETVKEVGLPYGVVVNKEGLGDSRIEHYCLSEKIPLLGKIPFDKEIATVNANAEILVDTHPHYRPLFTQLWSNIETLVKKGEL